MRGGPQCGGCGYNLTGAPGNRCPECGALFIDAGVVVKRPRPTGKPRRRIIIILAATAISLLPLILIFSAVGYYRAREMAARARAEALVAEASARAAVAAARDREARAATAARTSSQPASSQATPAPRTKPGK